MANDCRRNIHQNLLSANLIRPDVVSHYSTDSVQPPTFLPADERRFNLPDEAVLKVREGSAGLQQPDIGAEYFADECNGEVVERKSGNDVVVDAFARQLFDGTVNHGYLIASRAEPRIEFQEESQAFDEMLVEFDGIESIAWDQSLDDFACDRAGSRADFEDELWLARPFQWRRQCSREESTAGHDGAGRTEMPARFAEESATFAKEIHRGSPQRRLARVLARAVYRSIADFRVRAMKYLSLRVVSSLWAAACPPSPAPELPRHESKSLPPLAV